MWRSNGAETKFRFRHLATGKYLASYNRDHKAVDEIIDGDGSEPDTAISNDTSEWGLEITAERDTAYTLFELEPTKVTLSAQIERGACVRIRNVSSGEYLRANQSASPTKGSAFLDDSDVRDLFTYNALLLGSRSEEDAFVLQSCSDEVVNDLLLVLRAPRVS